MEDWMSVRLRSGDVIKIDSEDLRKFRSLWGETSKAGVKTVKSYRNGRPQILSRILMSPTKDQFIDHINGDRLDNRKANLRICTHAENMRNRKRNKNCSSGFKGVEKRGNKWSSRITFNGIRHYLGSFDTPEKAHAAYCDEADRLHGEFCNYG